MADPQQPVMRAAPRVSKKWVVGYAPNGPNNFFDTEAEAVAFLKAEEAKRTRNYVVFDDALPKIVNRQ